MKIDRHNYEECFLLYIDNELTVEERKQVDFFVKENPDLEEELIMLQQSRLIPDETIVFEEKHLLMMEENSSFINLNNYEEWLVLYLDDELSDEEKITVENFAAGHPNVRHELELFQQTKVQPEIFLFPDKGTLYKQETRKVVIMQWWKVAVAAVLVLSAGVTIYSILTTSGNNVPVKTATRQVIPVNKVQPTQAEPGKGVGEVARNNKKKEDEVAVMNGTGKKVREKPAKERDEAVQANNNKQEVSQGAQQAIAEAPKKVIADNTIGDKIATPEINNAVSVNDKKVDIDFNSKSVTSDRAQTPYNPEVASNTENKRFRGFFRKATRFIERTANINPTDDDNRVLIGGVAINLK